jgi:hypothetical protein
MKANACSCLPERVNYQVNYQLQTRGAVATVMISAAMIIEGSLLCLPDQFSAARL